MKLARLRVSDVLLNEILRGNSDGPLTTDAPPDLRVHGFVPEPGQPWTLTLVVGSESFPEVEDGALLPEVSYTYRRSSRGAGEGT